MRRTAAQPGMPRRPAGRSVSLGEPGFFWRLLTRGAVLLMFTLGIYRFWLTTDVRRFLWSNTDLAGETFEYTGTARELLLGFLIAIAILVPLYTAFFVIRRSSGTIGELSSCAVDRLLLVVLGNYAIYRARRYRLTRTVYRGVRFHQTGSAWRYAVCAMFWWSLDRPDLGPRLSVRAVAARALQDAQHLLRRPARPLRRHRMALFVRGILMWFLSIVPFMAGWSRRGRAIDWDTLAADGGSDDLFGWLEASGLPARSSMPASR